MNGWNDINTRKTYITTLRQDKATKKNILITSTVGFIYHQIEKNSRNSPAAQSIWSKKKPAFLVNNIPHFCFCSDIPRKDWLLLRQRTQAEPYVNAVLLPKKAAFIFGKMKSQISFVIVRCKFLLWKKTTFIDAEKISAEFCSSTPRNKKLIWTLQLKSFVWIYKNVTALSLFK